MRMAGSKHNRNWFQSARLLSYIINCYCDPYTPAEVLDKYNTQKLPVTF